MLLVLVASLWAQLAVTFLVASVFIGVFTDAALFAHGRILYIRVKTLRALVAVRQSIMLALVCSLAKAFAR